MKGACPGVADSFTTRERLTVVLLSVLVLLFLLLDVFTVF